MSDIEKYLQSKGLSKATVKHYHMQILNFITWCDMENVETEQVSSTDVMAYLRYLQNKGHQSLTRSIQLNILKHYFNYQISNEQRQSNPTRAIKIRGAKSNTLYPVFSKQELENIYHRYELPTEQHDSNKKNWFANYRLSRQRNKAILSLMVYQGLATDEINRLSVQDVKLKEGTIYIAGSRKSNERTLELKPHQVMELMEYGLTTRKELLKLSDKQSDLYFLQVPSAGKRAVIETLKTADCINIWKRLSEEIRAEHKKFINFRQVRASVITHWLKSYNLRQVQYMAGHRYISSTESYLANQMEDLQADIDQYHPIG